MSSPLPSITNQIADDHVALQATLQHLGELIGDAARGEEAHRILQQLIAQLEDHFRHEEEGGYFREMAYRLPHLARLATSLEHEHPRLLCRLREIEHHLAGCAGSRDALPRVAQEFRRFAIAITTHEEDEHRLLQESANCELGCND